MQTTKTMFFLILPIFIFLLSGCPAAQLSPEVVLVPEPISHQQGHSSTELEKRFKQPASEGETAVESAIELSKKYAKLSEQTAAIRQNNNELITENRQLKNQLTIYQKQLQQTKKELAEANDLLIEMRIELNNWKTDILGFRGEMREAEKAQLQALLKILKILGGEVKKESVPGENTSLSANASSQLQTQSPNTGTSSGDTNE